MPTALRTQDYLGILGVPALPALTSPFDPGYDPATLASHLEQSYHLMAALKLSMVCWLLADVIDGSELAVSGKGAGQAGAPVFCKLPSYGSVVHCGHNMTNTDILRRNLMEAKKKRI